MGKVYHQEDDKNAIEFNKQLPENIAKYLPKEAVLYSNLLCALCLKCKNAKMNARHLKESHGLSIETMSTLTTRLHNHIIKNLSSKGKKRKVKRKIKIEYAAKEFISQITKLQAFLKI